MVTVSSFASKRLATKWKLRAAIALFTLAALFPGTWLGPGESLSVQPWTEGAAPKRDPSDASTTQLYGTSVTVVREADTLLPADNETSFEIEFFADKPTCDPLTEQQISFTLTTQLSLDRMWIMKHQCERWPPPFPISIAVYLPPNSQHNVDHVLNRLDNECHCDRSRMHITILIGVHGHDQYPVNTLRNLALQHVDHTSHALYIDSDFLISEGLHGDLMAAATWLTNQSNLALVVPAFDYIPNCKTDTQEQALACLRSEWDTIPKTQSELIPLLSTESPPRVERGFQSIHGKNRYHGTTMYKTWILNQTTPIEIPCIKHPTYEPYLAFRVCQNLPRFPELFRGWGFNKITWIKILLKKLGYRLLQLPRGFVLHLPHELSPSRQKSPDGHPPEFDAYLNWLAELAPHPNHLPNCVDWKKENGPLQDL